MPNQVVTPPLLRRICLECERRLSESPFDRVFKQKYDWSVVTLYWRRRGNLPEGFQCLLRVQCLAEMAHAIAKCSFSKLRKLVSVLLMSRKSCLNGWSACRWLRRSSVATKDEGIYVLTRLRVISPPRVLGCCRNWKAPWDVFAG